MSPHSRTAFGSGSRHGAVGPSDLGCGLLESCDNIRGNNATPLERLANRLVTPTGLEIKY